MHPLFKCYLNGVHDRGKGGVVYKKGEEATYVFPSQFPEEKFRGGIQTLVDDPVNTDTFFIVEEMEGQAVVRAYNLQSVLADAAEREPK